MYEVFCIDSMNSSAIYKYLCYIENCLHQLIGKYMYVYKHHALRSIHYLQQVMSPINVHKCNPCQKSCTMVTMAMVTRPMLNVQ